VTPDARLLLFALLAVIALVVLIARFKLHPFIALVSVSLVLGLAAGIVIDLVSAPAWALCPNCLGQSDTLSPTMRIVGVFLLVPIAVFFAGIRQSDPEPVSA